MKYARKFSALFFAGMLLFSSLTSFADEVPVVEVAPAGITAEEVEAVGTDNVAEVEEVVEVSKENQENVTDEATVYITDGGKELYSSPEVVWYNTGTKNESVAAAGFYAEDFKADYEFDEDGAYTIIIGEENPFFPYEVQFTSEGKTETKWFMSPTDTQEVAGHVFRIQANFSDDVVTSMTLSVAGEEVTVYPQKKVFTDGGLLTSMLPLEEKYLSVDLSEFSPLHLTRVQVKNLFTGDNALTNEKVVFSGDGAQYTVNTGTDYLDLSMYTNFGGSYSYTMYVGDADQLTKTNIKYQINVKVSEWKDWLQPSLYAEGSGSDRQSVKINRYDYHDYDLTNRYATIYLQDEWNRDNAMYFCIDPSSIVPADSTLKVYEGDYENYQSIDKMLANGKDITEKILAAEKTAKGAGLLLENQYAEYLALVTYNGTEITGYLPIRIDFIQNSVSVNLQGPYYTKNGSRRSTSYSSFHSTIDGVDHYEIKLYKEISLDEKYDIGFRISQYGTSDTSAIKYVFEGKYNSYDEAVKAGAKDIHELTAESKYSTDIKSKKYFTIIYNDGKGKADSVFICSYTFVAGDRSIDETSYGSSMWIRDFLDENKNVIKCVKIGSNDDSYADYNYIPVFVGKDTDLTKLAIVFDQSLDSKVYAQGMSSPLKSGETLLDFSKGAVQLSVSSGDGKTATNYWVQLITASDNGGLYITSFGDTDSETVTENGVIKTKREVMVDGYHNDIHDIFVANTGKEPIERISAELNATGVVLDEYWSLSGNNDLDGMSDEITGYGDYKDLTNLAKVRLLAAPDAAQGTEISGTLTIKSAGSTIMIITLTGTIGDPCITTDSIPDSVLYVPYGTMIQNSNKYSWNTPKYRLMSGRLPKGMELKENGEIYGVPKETGKFSIRVRMENSYNQFSSSTASLTFTVKENTDTNVDGETDTGYMLSERIPDLMYNTSASHLMVSQGVLVEFVDIYLDGEKLVPGTDYEKESGSTRITIKGQTLSKKAVGRHTLGLEFREKGTDLLKKAAQNYYVKDSNNNNNSSNGNTGKKIYSTGTRSAVQKLERSEYCNPDKAASGTWTIDPATGKWTFAIRGIKVKNDWAFLVNDYAAEGQEKESWFHFDVDGNMQTGWFDDADGKRYYLWPVSDNTLGHMVSGQQTIDGRICRFNTAHDGYFGALQN